ncbi:glycosyltransferase [Patescibacteria group bacterium]
MDLIAKNESVSQPTLFQTEIDEIVVFISGLALGGAEYIVTDWARRVYPKRNIRIIVLRDNDREWNVPDFIKVTRFHGKSIEASLAIFGRKIALGNNPVCLCHLLKQSEREILIKNGVFVVPVLHNARSGWLDNSDDLLCYQKIIAVSYDAEKALKETGWKGDCSVIHHIPSLRRFHPEAREFFRGKWKIPKDALVIGMIGAVKPQKNYTFALNVLVELQSLGLDPYLVILGGPIGKSGNYFWREIIQEIESLGVRNRVAMPGFVSDAIKCLPVFDLMLNTSHYEGLSMATVEAVINGTRIVASDVGGQSEVSHERLKLIPLEKSVFYWAQEIRKILGVEPKGNPSWVRFPSHRLWTITQIARSFIPENKTLFVTANLNSGGAQRSLVNLSLELQCKLDFEIAVTGNSTASYYMDQLRHGNVRFFRTSASNDCFEHVEALVEKICREKIGTVCFWNLDPKIKLLLVKALGFTDVKFVDVSPGNMIYSELDDTAEFQDLICFSSDKYFERIDELVLKYNGVYPEVCKKRVSVIPNGVPDYGCAKVDYRIKDNPRIVVSGRIAPTKFLVEIVRAMQIIWQSLPKSELHIFGMAEERNTTYLEELLDIVNDDERIIFHGMDFEVAKKISDFDLYVVLGEAQGCPNALLEAMSVGLPVVANDDGGTEEQVINRETGILIQGRSPEELSEAMLELLLDRGLATKVGTSAKFHIKENFSMQSMSNAYFHALNQKQGVLDRIRTLCARFLRCSVWVYKRDDSLIQDA